jgi:biotin carboxyl carrier protein
VEAGQPLVIVEAMKMQMELKSPRAGQVAAVHVEPGQEVNQGQALAVIADLA